MASDRGHRLRAKARAKKKAVFKRYGKICFYCNEAMADTIDHFIPISKGGTNDIGNLRPACYSCNKEKRDLIPDES